ncbi:hypothetical protein DFH07DRAFT_940193 [Mycena maculata]|uniref:Uncharacterized protein n=1 Tax=Mycena maculata TaxID=230809 RepID=A0AAD7J7Z3_9AGAR|nr:hypothetical protein DFH07DRAFT_940193 [Mycena maculata]
MADLDGNFRGARGEEDLRTPRRTCGIGYLGTGFQRADGNEGKVDSEGGGVNGRAPERGISGNTQAQRSIERVVRARFEMCSEREIRNRWLRIVNNRIALDCALTESAKYGHRSLKKSIVCKTWSKVLLDEDRLPDDWMRETRVLVGIG